MDDSYKLVMSVDMVRARLSELMFENFVEACAEYELPHELLLLWPKGARGKGEPSSKALGVGETGELTLPRAEDGEANAKGDPISPLLEASRAESEKSREPICSSRLRNW
jgi:hypothetical protein